MDVGPAGTPPGRALRAPAAVAAVPGPGPAGAPEAQPAGRQAGRLAPEIWLLAQRPVGSRKILKYFFIHLPTTTALKRLVWIAHQRWAIEQQYQQLKDELGLDHFEGRSYPGWNRHVALTAVAYTFLQQERRHTRGTPLTFPTVRALVAEIFTALYFAANPKQLDYIIQLRRHLPLRI